MEEGNYDNNSQSWKRATMITIPKAEKYGKEQL